jgi:hypothetical protein
MQRSNLNMTGRCRNLAEIVRNRQGSGDARTLEEGQPGNDSKAADHGRSPQAAAAE